jgi:glycosyltransferase involved in cell wall biosynthesis
MAQSSSAPRPGVTVVIPAHNAADQLDKLLPAWGAALARWKRPYEILVVDDGSTDATPALLEQLAGRRDQNLRGLRHDARRGFGACLRTALAQARLPLFFYTAPGYPYTPEDLHGMLDRIELRDEILGKQADLISGARRGLLAPDVVRVAGWAWRAFWRVFAGIRLEPAEAWPGLGAAVYGKFAGWVFGVPLADVNSAFKLYRTDFLRRFPIQSDGDFVHTELVAKATFLTSIMDEVPLTPQPGAVPPKARISLGELLHVFRDPQFAWPAPASPPAEPAPVVPGPA